MIFAPINVAAFMYTPRHLRGAAVGLFALLRNEGGSVGTSMAQTIQERRDQFHTSRVGEFLDPFNPTVSSFLEQAQAFFFQQTGDAPGSQQMALQTLADLREQQAASLAYFDVFFVCGRPGGGARVPGAADETLGGRKGRPTSGGINLIASTYCAVRRVVPRPRAQAPPLLLLRKRLIAEMFLFFGMHSVFTTVSVFVAEAQFMTRDLAGLHGLLNTSASKSIGPLMRAVFCSRVASSRVI